MGSERLACVMRDDTGRRELGFLASPSSQVSRYSQPQDEPWSPSLITATCCSTEDCSAWSMPGGCWTCLGEGSSGVLSSWHPVLMRTSWAGPPEHFKGPHIPEWWLCKMEPVARGSCSWTNLQFRRQIERREFQTCLCILPILDPGRVWSTQIPRLYLLSLSGL